MKPLLINSTNQYQRIPYLYFEVFFALILFGSCTDSEESVDTTEVQIVEVPVTDKLPQVYVNTNGQEIPDEPKIFAEISIENKGTLTHEGFIGIEIRGQSSQMFPKKHSGISFRQFVSEIEALHFRQSFSRHPKAHDSLGNWYNYPLFVIR